MRHTRVPWRRWRPTAVVAAGTALLLTTTGLPAFATPSPAPAVTPPNATVDETQALTQARSSGRPVDVTVRTTPTETLTANPDGSLTMTQAVQPVRKKVGDTWQDLDPTLTLAADGTIVPKSAVGDLHLSDGGTGAFASMTGNGSSLALTAPFKLSKPTLAGDTATYPGVLPGVDLAVTADTQGGFSEVFVIANASAAANPQLSRLTFTTEAKGLKLSSDAAGNIIGTNATGRAIVSAAAPRMWDSTTAAVSEPTVVVRSGVRVNASSGQRALSTARSPGQGAQVAPVAAGVSAQGITLTPAKSLLTGAGVHWPVYIDPSFQWSSSGSAVGGWAVISQNASSTKYWKDSPSNQDDMQSGHDPETGDVRRTMLNFAIDTSVLSGATINDAQLGITEEYSYNCTASQVDLYAPSKDLTSSNADWDDWSGVSLGSQVDNANVAYGWSSACPAKSVPFNILSPVQADVSSGNKSQTFVLKADDEGSIGGWKRWNKDTPKITIHFNHVPTKPNNLSTSPLTSCTGATVGNTAMTLYANVSDPDGGTIGETYKIWKTSDTSVSYASDPAKLTGGSGTSALPFQVPETFFKAAANGAATSFSWNVTITDFQSTSPVSTTCRFTWDPTTQGPPDLTQPVGAKIGLPVDIPVKFITENAGDTVPASYQFQINGGVPDTVTADASGNASITVTPRRLINTVTVTSQSAGKNFGGTAAVTFLASPANLASDGDLNGDGLADLLTVGGTNGVPSGVWTAAGTGSPSPSLNTLSTDLGSVGNGTQGDNQPSDFDQAQTITGHFTGGGLQDILFYYPHGGIADGGVNTGGGGVLLGNGDGSPIFSDRDGNSAGILPGLYADPITGDNPLMLANAGSTTAGSLYPDLIGTIGDATNGYSLEYYQAFGTLTYGWPTPLAVPSPDGAMDWNLWTISTAQRTDGTVDMFLWNRTTGALHLWSGLTFDVNTGIFAYALDTTLADGTTTRFVHDTVTTIQAADINRDGTPDLWAVGAGGATTAYIVTNAAATGIGIGTITAQTAQTLNTSSHTWLLNDGASGDPVGARQARDEVGTLNGTGSGDAAWASGDMWSPDVKLSGTGAVTMSQAVTTNADFSVSVWAKPAAYNGVIFAQDGVNGAGFKIWPSSDTTWDFAMSQSDKASTSAVWDTAKSATGAAKLDVWYHITATYQASIKKMFIYVNDRLAGTATHSTPWSATGSFRAGAVRTSATALDSYFTGQLADAQTWNVVIQPLASPNAPTAGVWRAYGTTNPITSSTSSWHCGTTGTVESDVLAQACVVRTPDGKSIQAAVIVRNNRSTLYSAGVTMDLEDPSDNYIAPGAWKCPSSGVAANSWSVCFGQTFGYRLAEVGFASVNNQLLVSSPLG